MAAYQSQIYVFCFVLFSRTTLALWSCSNDLDCTSIQGSLCVQGECVCPAGQEAVLGGTRCFNVATYYHLSSCLENFQCSRLVTGFACNVNGDEGFCDCAVGHHYFRGRCWPSREYGDSCARDEECQSILRNPFNMQCSNGHCACADGYYLRQRGECRKAGYAVGDGCVLDVDCQFQNGVCDQSSFACYNSQEGIPEQTTGRLSIRASANSTSTMSRQDGVQCNDGAACQPPFVCTNQNVCACPIGYYPNDDGTDCLAHLGSPSTPEQCVGLFKIIEDGVCTCQANFYYENNMRDCAKATLRISDFCFSDAMCHTFGVASYCGEPVEPWGLRSCQCDPEIAVRNDASAVCQLFRGIDEECESDDECYAGELPIPCATDDSGLRRCTCPPHLRPEDGLCLDSDLVLGDTCQVTAECNATEHSICENSVCTCPSGFQQVGEICSPQLGGPCVQDGDCFIDNTGCVESDGTTTCQCVQGFVRFDDECLPVSEGYNSTCVQDVQCYDTLGDGGACIDNGCFCNQNYHYLNERCWKSIGLLGECSTSIDCFLGDLTDRVVCRNSLCQCDFDYVFLEEEHTCGSATSIIFNNATLLLSILTYYMLQRYV